MTDKLAYQVAQILKNDDLNVPKTEATGTSVRNILQIAFMIAGGMAIIFIIVGGLKYVLSSGDPAQTVKAKNTILYAIVGLIFALIAFVIVSIVVRTIQK